MGTLEATAAAFVVAGAVGCWGSGSAPCVAGAQVGRSYRVTVLERYGADSTMARFDPKLFQHTGSPSCGDGLDFGPGRTLDLKVIRTDDHPACSHREAEPSNLAEVSFDGAAQTGIGSNTGLMFASVAVTTAAGCEGKWGVELQVPDRGDPFRAPSSGALPPVLLERVFYPSNAVCDRPDLCVDDYIVKVDEL